MSGRTVNRLPTNNRGLVACPGPVLSCRRCRRALHPAGGGGPPAVSPIMPGGFREWLGHQRRRPDCTGQFARAIDRIERARGAPLGDLVGMRAVCHADHGETLPLMPDMTTADWRTWLLARRLLRPLSASE